MSSDGVSEKPRPARPGRSDDTGAVQVGMAVLLVLAVAATVVMVFSENPVWMRIGTLAALWAAFIGAFLVGRYKRQAAGEAARVRDLHTVYELQLEREISARREHELVVEKDLREKVRAETGESVTALREEIAALREQLAQLTGQPLPEDRLAVGRDTPAAALTSGTPAGPRTSVPSERVQPRRAAAPASGGVGPNATPSTERTGRIQPVVGDGSGTIGEPRTGGDPRADTGRRPAVRPASPSVPVTPTGPGTPSTPAPTSGTGSTAFGGGSLGGGALGGGAEGWGAESRRPSPTTTPAQPVSPQRETTSSRPHPEGRHERPEQQTPAQQSTEQHTGGRDETEQHTGARGETEQQRTERQETERQETERREAEERARHAQGSSVAELMARLGAESTGGGRRRRSRD